MGSSVGVGVRTAVLGLEMSKYIVIFFMETLYYIEDGEMFFIMLSIVTELVREQNTLVFKSPSKKTASTVWSNM